MKETQKNLFHDETEVDDERAREHEMDLTPAPLVRQILEVLGERQVSCLPPSILDPCAGAGVVGQEARKLWGEECGTLHALELRCEEAQNLLENYDHYHVGDCVRFLSGGIQDGKAPPDLIITNPAFSIAMELVPLALRTVSGCGVVCFLQLDDFGQRSKAGLALFDKLPPTHQFRIAGPVKYRVGTNPKSGKPYTHDTRSYSWWVWDIALRRHTRGGNSWLCENLPRLEPKDRKWTTRPGEDWKMKL